MKPLTIASYLWTKTRSIKIKDLKPLIENQGLNLRQWQKSISNYNLKQYLLRHPDWVQQNIIELKEMNQLNISYSHYGREDYLSAFLNIDSPPIFYSYRGNLDLLNQKSLAVVGSRRASEASIRWLESQFFYFLKNSPRVIVSGAAIGIDQLSHQIALDCFCPIVTIYPSGLLNPYPKSYQKIRNQSCGTNILEISEYSLWDGMKRHYFSQRNRLIAALGKEVFVVEARRRSGSLITARYAMDMGKDIYVLPSCPLSTQRLGSLDLMYDGAYAIRDHMDMKASIF